MKRKLFLSAALALVTVILLCHTAFPQAAAPAAPAAAAAPANPPAPLKVESTVTLWELIKSGGWAMWPLGACSFATIGLIILNFQRVSTRRLMPMEVIGRLKAAAAAGNLQEMHNLANSNDSMFTRALLSGLKKVNPEDPAGSKAQIEQAISETAGQEESKYAFYVNFLSLLTSMSPMWGLLGTVSGKIGAFSKIGSGGMGKPEMLAKNIGEALVCTATGLLIAITAMAFYFLFRNILNNVMSQSEAHYSEIVDTMINGGNGN